MWLEIELDLSGEDVRVSARGSRGERPPSHAFSPDWSFEALQSFSTRVGRAVRGGRALDETLVEQGHAFYRELFQEEVRDVLTRLGEATKEKKLLIRLFLRDRALQIIPWEALCRPGTTEGFLGTDGKLLVARGVASSDPWEPREVRGSVRVLAVAPGSDERALAVLKEALDPSIETGEVEWLEPIAGDEISARVLFDRLRRGKSPHILHWLGHGGVDAAGKPVLRMADDEDGEEVWMTAETLGRELGSTFCEELRLIILEACEGAKSGMLGSAAEILAKAGADAVIAHLWPVKADVARTCSSEIYRSLTGADRTSGDIGASVAAARRTLLTKSAEAFSPILFLRGADSEIFNFEDRRVSKPSGKRRGPRLPPALQALLDKPFTLVMGDIDEDRDVLRRELLTFLEENGETIPPEQSLITITQRCALKFGQEVLNSLFQQTVIGTLQTPPPPLIEQMANFAKPGIHVTLLWRPYVERAIADKHPDHNVYAIQPALSGSANRPRVVKRAAGAPNWKMDPLLPKRFDLDNDIVILRLYGGYSAEARPIFSQPVLTEDDHVQGLLTSDAGQVPSWMEELLARARTQPGLFLGMSVLDFRHRLLLRWLYDQRPAPKDSMAILMPGTPSGEVEIWDNGGGLPGTGRINAITEEPNVLAELLADFVPEGAS